jgi:lysophospholipase L1-like esterase
VKRWIGNFAALVVSLAVMAGIYELACRTIADTGMQYEIEMWKYAVKLKRIAADPAIGHEHVPNASAHLMGADVAINSLGLREREIPPEKPDGTTRIMVLGDSIVFGWGVRAEDTLPANLERDLDAAGAFGHAQVINTGVGNYNTAMEVEYFLKSGAALNPDIVVLGYFINDAEPTPTYKPVPWIARHSYAYAITGGAWDTFKRMVLGGPDWKAYYAGLYTDDAPGWKAAQDAVRRLAAYCHSHNIRLVLANIPELRELNPYPFATVNARIAVLAAENGVEYIDLLPALQDQQPASLWVTAPDPHPNAKAQGLMARRLADYLLKGGKTARETD